MNISGQGSLFIGPEPFDTALNGIDSCLALWYDNVFQVCVGHFLPESCKQPFLQGALVPSVGSERNQVLRLGLLIATGFVIVFKTFQWAGKHN